jgi:DNA processing protein
LSDDLIDRLRLVRSPGIGPITYRQLIARFGNPAAALAAVPDLARRGGGRAPSLFNRADAQRDIARSKRSALAIWSSGRGCIRTCWPKWTTRRRC